MANLTSAPTVKRFGPRMPLIVISPFAKENFVDHTVTDQSSIVHFIEELESRQNRRLLVRPVLGNSA